MDVVWVPRRFYSSPGRFGVASMPGFEDHGVERDLARLQQESASHLVSLVEEHEFEQLEPPETAEQRARLVRSFGFLYYPLPVVDLSVPALAEARAVVDHATAAMRHGGKVLFHCGAELERWPRVLSGLSG